MVLGTLHPLEAHDTHFEFLNYKSRDEILQEPVHYKQD